MRFLWLNMLFLLLILETSLLSSVNFAQSAFNKITNRSPVEGEIRPYPHDGADVRVDPPGFVWLPEEEAASYTLQCSRQEDFTEISYEKSNIDLNVHCPSIILGKGSWFWRYRFTSKQKEISSWSQIRSYRVDAAAVGFPQPTLHQLMDSMPQAHPKLFLRPEQVESFKDRIGRVSPSLWKNFIAHAETMLETPVVTDEPSPYPDGKRDQNHKPDIDLWRLNRRITIKAVEHAANLAFAYLLTGEQRYGLRAREWMLAVASWPPDGTTSYRYNDECGMPILSRIPRAYTWAYSVLSKEDRRIITASMNVRGDEVYRHLKDRRQHTVHPFASHSNRAWHFMGETAVAFIDDIPEAKDWLNYAMTIFYNTYPAWSDDDGGWHEGTAYWNSYINRVTWWLDTMKSTFNLDGYKKPYFKHSGDFPLYVMPPGSEFGGFSDSANKIRPKHVAPLMKALAGSAKNPYWMWYANQTGGRQTNSKPTYLDLLRSNQRGIYPVPPTEIPQSKIFAGVGIASLHTNLAEADQDMHVLFKSSPFGTQSHGFNAQNSFMLNLFGKPLLFWSGHRDWHGSAHHKKWMWETKSDNAITVNGIGQKIKDSNPTGRFTDWYLSDEFDYVAGEAGGAYEGRLESYTRHIFFVKPRLVLMLDQLKATEPSTFEYYLHGANEFEIDGQFRIKTTNEKSAVLISLVTPTNLNITQTSLMDPPSVGFEDEQWHLKAETQEKRRDVMFLSVMRGYPSHKQIRVFYNTGRAGQAEIYDLKIENNNVMLAYNPTRELFTMGGLKTDAAIVLISGNKSKQDESRLFVVQATEVEVQGETVFESDIPAHFHTLWKDLELLEN